jgi:hypothetical protein
MDESNKKLCKHISTCRIGSPALPVDKCSLDLPAPHPCPDFEPAQTVKPEAQEITEEDGIHEQWYKDAREVIPETLQAFIERLTNDYVHDYRTIAHAAAASALAAVNAVDESDQGGLIGYQINYILWRIILKIGAYPEGALLYMSNFDNMLYPQYADQFERTLKVAHWAAIQKRAAEALASTPVNEVDPQVREHWQSIVDGTVPFGWSVEEK